MFATFLRRMAFKHFSNIPAHSYKRMYKEFLSHAHYEVHHTTGEMSINPSSSTTFFLRVYPCS